MRIRAMVGKPECGTTVGCSLPYIIKRCALSVLAQISVGMKITEHKKSIAVNPSNVKLPHCLTLNLTEKEAVHHVKILSTGALLRTN